MKRLITVQVILTAMLSLCGCCDDRDSSIPESWAVSAVGAEGGNLTLSWHASYESVTVSISGCAPDTRAVIVSTDNDWLTVAGDTLAADGIVSFTTTTNNTGLRRTATLTFTDADNTSRRAMLDITQLSASDATDNGPDARQELYVGYGYDIYKALESPMAVRTKQPVIDLDFLRQENIAAHYEIIQDCRITRTETRYVCTNDIHAFGKNLSEQQTNDTDNRFEGCRENCITAEELLKSAKGKLEQHDIGHGSLEKAVATRVIDRGALIDLQRRREVPFTDEFSTRLWNVRHASGQARDEAIEQLLVEYGTHVIIQADLGGRIDYTFTMQKQTAFNSVQEMREEIDYTLGRVADNDRTTNRNPATSKSQSGAITVAGGSASTRERLEADIRGLNASGQIDPGHITDWLASINYTSNPETDPNLEVIHFELIPLWDLVWDDLRNDFRNATFRMVNRSNCGLPASFTGTDIYEINPWQETDLFDFSSATDDSTLCRLLYFAGEPVMEVCQEYVPKIRTDERVIVAYPIYKGQIRMNQGLFLGDGIHQPANVGFSGSDCYVYPIYDYLPGERIETFYYVNGNLLLDDPTTTRGRKGSGRTVMGDMFYFVYGGLKKHPIVKIGSRFWTRHDIDHSMGFTVNPNSGRPRADEYEENGVLYARYQYDIHRLIMSNNEWIWGYVPNTGFDGNPNMRWYLPSVADVSDLHAFLGFNPKALFPGQVSGFNAGFNGYLGVHDFLNNSSFKDGKKTVRYKGQLNILATRNPEGDTDAVLLMLEPNYSFIATPAIGDWHNDYYPVRPVRGFMFEYPTLKTIKEHS